MLEVGFQAVQRSFSEADGEVENGRMLDVEAGALIIERDAIGEDRVTQRLSKCRSMRHQAIEAAIGHRNRYSDHLALGGAEIFGRLVQLLIVRRPSGEALRTEAVNAEYIRYETKAAGALSKRDRVNFRAT